MASDGTVSIDVKYNTKKAETNLNNLDTKAKDMGKSMSKKVSGPAAAGLGAITAGVVTTTAKYDELAKTTKAWNVSSAGSLNSMRHVTDLFGISNEELDGTLKGITKSVAMYGDSYDELGIQTKDANGNLLSSDEIMFNMIDKLGSMDEATRNEFLAMNGLGRQVGTFNKVMVDANGFTETYNDHLSETGESTNELAEKSEILQDKITVLMDNVKNFVAELLIWMFEHKNLVIVLGGFLIILALLGPALYLVGTAITVVKGVMTLLKKETWKTVFALIAKGFAWLWANLVMILVIIVIGLLIIALIWIWQNIEIVIEWIKKFIQWFKDLWQAIKDFAISVYNIIAEWFTKVIDFWKGIWDRFKSIVKSVVDAVINIIKGFINGIISTLNFGISAIERFLNSFVNMGNFIADILGKIPGIKKIVGDFQFNAISLPRIPSLDVGTDMVMSDGLAMIHKGEAVVPANVVGGGFSGAGGSTMGDVNVKVEVGSVDSQSRVDDIMDGINKVLGKTMGVNYYGNN
jgi:phage-related protein